MSKPYVVGIDIGGTNTVFGIVDARGHVVAADSVKTRKHSDFDDYIAELYEGLSRLIKANEAENQIQGIGIGAPNGNYYTGEIINPPNLPWGPVIPLAEKVSKAFGGIPVAVTNDANAAALGEMTYGAARGMKDFIMITLGTAREFLEVRTEPSLLRNMEIEDITSKDVYDAAMAGDKLAKEIFNYTGEILGEAFADMAAFSSPQAFILFGGLAKSGDLLLKPIKESFDKNVMPVFKGKSKILVSELKESDAAVLGASALGWEARYRYEAPHIEKIEEEL